MNGWTIAGTSFLACGVEMVEALTIVLAVGVARGWRPALSAATWAIAILIAVFAIARPALLWLAPLPAFKAAVGAVALYYGSGWLRKAILRAAGRKALHDENAIYAAEVAALNHVDHRAAFASAFNGVFFEGVEAVVIVLALAAGSSAELPWAAGGALAALALVVGLGFALRRPLERVPENTLKFLVGTMLTTFGIFWIGESTGAPLWSDDAVIALLAVAVCGGSLVAVRVLKGSLP